MALQNLKKYFEGSNSNEFMDLLSNKCIVTERIDGSSFHVKRNKTDFSYYKSGSKTEMNAVDRTIVRYYENAIRHFKTITEEAKLDMPFDWKFGFEYLGDNKTIDIEYDVLPKSNLVLTHIQVMQPSNPNKVRKVIRDNKILNKWADLLEVNRPPVLFEGILHSGQKSAIIDVLETSVNEFEDRFENPDRPSFTRVVYSIFNENQKASALMNDLSKDVSGFIVNFHDGKEVKTFILEKFNKQPRPERKPSDMYQISILDIVEHFMQFDIESIELKEENSDIRYLELMSEMFNSYIQDNATKYIGAKFDSADFAESPMFELNHKFIKNEKTLTLLQDKTLAELFKITLGSFRKKRSKDTDIINGDMLKSLNDVVEKVENKILAKANEDSVMNFKQYLVNQKISAEVAPVMEALKVDYPEHGKKLVNMFVGRFQPFTLGHAKVVETIYKQNGYPVVILLVKAKNKKKEDAFKRPYDEATQVAMINRLKGKLPIEDIFVIPTGGIDTMFNAMRPKYEPVLWGTGSDRMKTYGYQVDKQEYRDALDVRDDFGLFEIPRTGKNISATQVRNAMLDGDEKLFKKLTPRPLHNMYAELKQKLEDSMGVMAESTEVEFLTFDDFIKNI